jgi:hypothetical protein
MAGRPSKTLNFSPLIPFYFQLSALHRAEYSKVTARGYPALWFPGLAGQKVTVILGKRVCLSTVSISPDDPVFICEVGAQGNLSSIGKEHAGKDITIIYYHECKTQ